MSVTHVKGPLGHVDAELLALGALLVLDLAVLVEAEVGGVRDVELVERVVVVLAERHEQLVDVAQVERVGVRARQVAQLVVQLLPFEGLVGNKINCTRKKDL